MPFGAPAHEALGEVIPLSAQPFERQVKFVAQPLSTPHIARSKDGGDAALYVRFSARMPSGDVAYPPDLQEEIRLALAEARRSGKPVRRAIIVGTDVLFPAGQVESEVQEAEGYDRALEALVGAFERFAEDRVPVLWRTRGGLKGSLPRVLAERLQDLGAFLSLEIGLPTLDDSISRALEGPNVAPPTSRLRLATAIHARGIPVRGLIDPLVPMLTDTPASLEPLLRSLADAGVHRIGIRYLILTRGRAKQLAAGLSKMQRALIRGCFQNEPWLPGEPDADSAHSRGPHKLLPENLRERGHQRVTDAAARLGIAVFVLDPAAVAEGLSEVRPAARRRPKRARPQLDLFRARREPS
jgi:hypothetical protein